MKKHIVLSVNSNPDYLYHVPLACWAWRYFGWEPILFCRADKLSEAGCLALDDHGLDVQHVKENDGYRSDTITQVSRLYAACHFDDSYLMTGDIDMIPLSDYWQPPNDKPTVWGFDLTGYKHYPICYIGMNSFFWRGVMKISGTDHNGFINRDLDTMPQAKSTDFNKFWYVDQQLITDRLKPFNPTIINRGQYPNGFARGRIDRGAWTLDHKEYIDCHLHHQIHHKQNDWKFKQTLEMLHKCFPGEDFTWYENYHYQFKKLTGHL